MTPPIDINPNPNPKALGYNYIILDDCWAYGRGNDSKLIWDMSRFPSGIPHLVQWLHEKHFKFGQSRPPVNKGKKGENNMLSLISRPIHLSWKSDLLQWWKRYQGVTDPIGHVIFVVTISATGPWISRALRP